MPDDPFATTALPPSAADPAGMTATFGDAAPPPAYAGRPPAVPGFEIVRELGRGGMGVVYLARQTALSREVALKMILAGGHASAADRARFQAEARAVAAVRHPGIVQVFESGTADGLPYFALEYCPGGSLAAALNGTPLPPADAARTVERIAAAVQSAHDAGLVHRDLKPANVLMVGGEPKVTDFGLARQADSIDGLTASGAMLGSPSYMAPEQADGRPVSPQTDVYALGAILYECLTGRPPFRAATALETIRQVVRDEPVPPSRLQPRLPRDLETICLKCLEKDPARRYATADALAADLRAWLDGRPIVARPAGPVERAAKWARRHPAAAGLLAVVLIAAGGFAAVVTTANARLARERDAANAERAEAERQRAAAHARLETAVGAVDRMLVRVAGERWSGRPELQDERRQVLEDAVGFYRSLVADAGADPLVRREASRANLLTGWAYMAVGEPARAEPAARAAADLLAGLRADDPADPEHEVRAAEAHILLGHTAVLAARYADGLAAYRAAVELAEAAAAAHPDRADAKLTAVDGHAALAKFHMVADHPRAAAEAAAGLAVARSLGAAADAPFAHRLAVAAALVVAADADLLGNRVDAAAAEYAEADRVLAGLAGEHPPAARLVETYRWTRAKVDVQQGTVRLRRARTPAEVSAAVDRMRTGSAGYAALLAVHPRSFPYLLEKLMTDTALAEIYGRLGRPADRREAAAEADRLQATILRDNPHMTWVPIQTAAARSAQLVYRVTDGDLSGFESDVAALLRDAVPGIRPAVAYNVACASSRAAGVLAAHPAAGGPAAAVLRERFAARAVAAIAELRAAGYFADPGRLANLLADPDLAAVRGRADYRAAVAGLADAGRKQ